MKKLILAAPVIAITLGFASPSWGFGCPGHFTEAQAAIDSATAAMNGVSDAGTKGLVHSLIDDAKHLLMAAKHHHEKPAAGAFDHARALAKADAARGYAEAAETFANN